MKLSDLEVNKRATIKKIEQENNIKRRLLDLGLTPGTKIECALENLGSNLKAYMFRNSLIAIRKTDASSVLIEEIL